ncbi:MAG: class I SAM-dependent methyltransferase [Deltaproteobacteria bacterium]|nr:class I SAM-dependent methyltransferase [Deltaproteobacteria bacterium]
MLITEAISFYHRHWEMDLSGLYPSLISAQPAYQLMVLMIARQLACQQMYDAAASIAGTAAAFRVPGNFFPLFHAAALREAGNISSARDIAEKLLVVDPEDWDALSEIAQCDMQELFLPQDYYDVLHTIHTRLKLENYLEIGVAQGRSLALARCGTTPVGVDPATGSKEEIYFHSPEAAPQLFRMTSDDFFSSINLPEILGKRAIDVAFLDGLHLFEQTLRDFINVERFASPDSMILIHDCLPVNALVAERNRKSAFWLGDVWKIIPCLKTIRPDLDIVTLPVKPSGLAVIRNLDPSSRILERQFDSITEHFNGLSLPESWEEKCRLCCVTDKSPEQLFGIR